MQTFSKRNSLKNEYSGYGEASINLRNRLLVLYGKPFSGNEYHFGVGNTNWIHEVALSKDLQMHFGRKIQIEDFRNESKTTYDNVFDFIELYYKRALIDLDSTKRNKLHRSIYTAFVNSGSVYEFNRNGQVDLKIDDTTAEKITNVDKVIEPFNDAQDVYRACIDGIITRSKDPKNIIGDMYIVFEEYLKNTTKRSSLNEALRYLHENLSFHPTQIQIQKKLKAYRGDVWGSAHAGNSPIPDEKDALWYLESIIAQIKYIDNKTK